MSTKHKATFVLTLSIEPKGFHQQHSTLAVQMVDCSNSSLNSKTFACVGAPNQSQYVVDYQAVWVQSTSLAHARMETKCSQLNDTFEQPGGNFTTHLALFSIV